MSDEGAAPVPIIYGDGVHDDAPGLQAAVNGEPFEDRSGGVERLGPHALMVERANLALDAPVSLARHNGQHLFITECAIQLRRTGALFRDTDDFRGQINIHGCQFVGAALFDGFMAPRLDPGAHDRAESLLRSWLTPEQLEDRIVTHNFNVRGGSTGRQYRLGGGGCHELDGAGLDVAYLCFGPSDYSLPAPDRVLAQKLALECDEEATLRVANRMPMRQVGLAQAWMQAGMQAAQAMANAVPSAFDAQGLANAYREAQELQVQAIAQETERRRHRILFRVWLGTWGVAAVFFAWLAATHH